MERPGRERVVHLPLGPAGGEHLVATGDGERQLPHRPHRGAGRRAPRGAEPDLWTVSPAVDAAPLLAAPTPQRAGSVGGTSNADGTAGKGISGGRGRWWPRPWRRGSRPGRPCDRPRRGRRPPRVGEQRRDLDGQVVDVAGGDPQAGDARVDGRGEPADLGDDDGGAGGLGLSRHQAERLVAAGDQHRAGHRQQGAQRRVLEPAGPRDPLRGTDVDGQRLQRRAVRAVTGHDEPHARVPSRHGGQRPQHRREALLPLQPSGRHEQRSVGRHPQRPRAVGVRGRRDPGGGVDRGGDDVHARGVGAQDAHHLRAHRLGRDEHDVRAALRREGLHRSAFGGMHGTRELAVEAAGPAAELRGVDAVHPRRPQRPGGRGTGRRRHPVVRVDDHGVVGARQRGRHRRDGAGQRRSGADEVPPAPGSDRCPRQRHALHAHAVAHLDRRDVAQPADRRDVVPEGQHPDLVTRGGLGGREVGDQVAEAAVDHRRVLPRDVQDPHPAHRAASGRASSHGNGSSVPRWRRASCVAVLRRVSRGTGIEQRGQPVEARAVAGLAVAGVAGRLVARHHERPVARQHEQSLPHELVQVGTPPVGEPAGGALARQHVEQAPLHPDALVGEVAHGRAGPDREVLARTPRPVGEVDLAVDHGVRPVQRRAQRRGAHPGRRQRPQHGLEERRALVPPVAEQLGVPGHDDQAGRAPLGPQRAAGRAPRRRTPARRAAPAATRDPAGTSASRDLEPGDRERPQTGRGSTAWKSRYAGWVGYPEREDQTRSVTDRSRAAATTGSQPSASRRRASVRTRAAWPRRARRARTPSPSSTRSRPVRWPHSGDQTPTGVRPVRHRASSRPACRASPATASSRRGRKGWVAGPPAARRRRGRRGRAAPGAAGPPRSRPAPPAPGGGTELGGRGARSPGSGRAAASCARSDQSAVHARTARNPAGESGCDASTGRDAERGQVAPTLGCEPAQHVEHRR